MRTTKKHIEMTYFLKHDINKENIAFLRKLFLCKLEFSWAVCGNQWSMKTKHTHLVLGQYKHQRTKDESKMVLNIVFKCVVSTWILGTMFLAPLHKKSLAGSWKLSTLRKISFTKYHSVSLLSPDWKKKCHYTCLIAFIQKESRV